VSEENKDYIEVVSSMPLVVDQVASQKWRALANTAYFGTPTIPLEVPSSEIPQALKDVHWHINVGRRIQFRLRLYKDGSLEILPKADMQKSGVPPPTR
jgi:hypothetical protein